ncbi:Crp/Fnr family transcriptional regulator [Crocosphaera sp. UHCC 0190]|uniref:Crp/Fnr family transcriptional regulator n=1 Tax=Crocosphaera sp. UHCC 0190 TaxID=3110246 RepID=UPI002B21D499|nr:Crp/Fnr family transcriptional regulator [Crocosphaera sp. UHCC 0190]MEA5510077.1 Crp/Fnr family transcriptional regulator [Crocosphaera sp. UHCC 0190]
MLTDQASSKPLNQRLAALPKSEYDRLIPHLECVTLELGQVLHQPGELIESVYFPSEAVVSFVSILENGSTTEIALIGREGMIGLPVIWGGNSSTTHAIVQMADSSMKLKADVLKREFARGGELQRQLLLYNQALFTQVAQTAACNRHHNIKQRFARWLLSFQDGSDSHYLSLTQEFMADMLGVRRAGVTVAAKFLQKKGVIDYHRGTIQILKRRELEAFACECYWLVRKEYERLLNVPPLSHEVV